MPIPPGPHKDWIWPLSLIPRRLTAIESEFQPIKLFGTAPDKPGSITIGNVPREFTGHLDVPPEGTWVVAFPPHWAWTTKSGLKNRLSIARYDYNGHYYQIPSLRLDSVVAAFKFIGNLVLRLL